MRFFLHVSSGVFIQSPGKLYMSIVIEVYKCSLKNGQKDWQPATENRLPCLDLLPRTCGIGNGQFRCVVRVKLSELRRTDVEGRKEGRRACLLSLHSTPTACKQVELMADSAIMSISSKLGQSSEGLLERIVCLYRYAKRSQRIGCA